MPEFNIDPNFSVFHLAKRNRQKGLNITHLPVLKQISDEIENASLIDHAHNILFCGFQRLSQFEPYIEKFNKLAEECEQIYIFAVPDIEIDAIDNVSFVPLNENDQLAKEWFVVSYGAEFFSVLAAEEIMHPDTAQQEREYHGVWLFDLSMVEIIYDWLCLKVGLNQYHIEQTRDVFHNEIIMMERTISRLNDLIQREQVLNHDTVVQEAQYLLNTMLYPALENMKKLL